jgi:glutathione S-transferase
VLPFDKLPVLDLGNGVVLNDSGAILNYVGKLVGLCPSDPVQAAFSDITMAVMEDTWQ